MRQVRALILFSLAAFLAAPLAFAGTMTECGRYKVFGKITLEQDRPVLVIFAESLSETRLRLDPEAASPDSLGAFRTVLGYEGRRMMVRGRLQELPKGYRGRLVLEAAIPVLPVELGAPSTEEFQVLEPASCTTEGSGAEGSHGK